PVVVVTELEAKRHHPELGYFARQALRLLDDFRVRFGRLVEPVPVGELGGTIRVELNHSDRAILPAGDRVGGGEADTRILAVARNLKADGYDVTDISKDVPQGITSSSVGLSAE
ncbi:PIN domain-containing protein, partial [Streptomyces sp. BE20]|uniref:PIN domain-containing protein n=1 Tax=Streptomyces sp. BE20 TaxID=3002525 RepID=UPI002E78D751